MGIPVVFLAKPLPNVNSHSVNVAGVSPFPVPIESPGKGRSTVFIDTLNVYIDINIFPLSLTIVGLSIYLGRLLKR